MPENGKYLVLLVLEIKLEIEQELNWPIVTIFTFYDHTVF
jgi:hypothetical protein